MKDKLKFYLWLVGVSVPELGVSTMNKKKKGLLDQYHVRRRDGSSRKGKKHAKCAYFVLDLAHDKFAEDALLAYARSCESEYPKLAKALLAGIKRRAAARFNAEVRPTSGPLQVGDLVRFDSPCGSTGVIEALHDPGLGAYVTWYYGKDVRDEDMTARDSVALRNLVRVTLAEFNAVRNRNGFGS